ncbi:general transcription factor II-I repeat domain-containing protein 2B [Trichonephila clavipes]|nr:general transcription factor II-I repeat domain-containing protein 2B [Trichonephila clavipes]
MEDVSSELGNGGSRLHFLDETSRTLLLSARHSILECHCIIHQQALCAKSGLTSLDNVVTLVTKIVNLISSQALNKRKFDALLDEVNSVYNGLIMYNNVHWLSRGNVLQRFIDCLEEIRLFQQNESKIEHYPQLMDIMWLLKLMFFTDICQHFNELNIQLQGPNKTVIVMMNLIRAFEAKLYVESNNSQDNSTQSSRAGAMN